MTVRAGIFSFTNNGKILSEQVKKELDFDFFETNKPSEVKGFIKENFNKLDVLIFIGAIGIAIRLTKDYIVSKDTDPAIIVLDEKGKFAIPILSGHIGGANEITQIICQKLKMTPVITTATDINDKFAVDIFAKKNNLKIANIEDIKHISSAVLKGESINFSCDYDINGDFPFNFDEKSKVGICISNKVKKPFDITLNLVPKNIIIGVGCKKNTDSKMFENYVHRVLTENEISIMSVNKIASIDIKSNEKAILDFCEKYNIICEFYSDKELNSLVGEFTSSAFVKSITNVDNVCERSAVFANKNSKLILKKQSENGITIALSQSEWSCNF